MTARGRTAAACLVLFVVLAVAGASVVRLNLSQRSAVSDRLLVAQAAEIRAELGDQISQTVSLARGLRSFVAANPDLGDPERFQILLADLYRQGDNVRNLGLAPDNVLEYVYPLAGNEAAVGLRYEDVPEQFASVDRAIRTRGTVLAGPIDLAQGGRGLVNRTPVFLPNGTYWGMVTLVLDVEGLFRSVGLEVDRLDLDWGVRTVRSTFADATFVGGDEEAFDDPDTVLQMRVPNGSWELAVASTASEDATAWAVVAYLIAVAGAAVFGVLVYQAARDRQRVAALALRDALTNLPNRRLLDERAANALAIARRQETEVSLIYIDLDHFKPVNDTHGHEAGDHVLRVVAGRIRDAVRESDTVARVGGDEFVVLLLDTGRDGAEQVAATVSRRIREPVEWAGTGVVIAGSFGVAVFPEDGDDLLELSSHADRAMFSAKGEDRAPTRAGPRPRHGRQRDTDQM